MTSPAAVGPVPRDRPAGPRSLGLLELGRRLLEEGDYATARLSLQRRLRLVPTDPEAQYLMALTLLRTGDPARAADLLEPSRKDVEPAICAEIGEALLPSDPRTAIHWLRTACDADTGNDALRQRLAQAELTSDSPTRRTGRHRRERAWRRLS